MNRVDDKIVAKLSTTEPLNQMETVLMMLQANGDNGVCGADFRDMHIPRYSSRLGELKGEGYHIARRRCENPRHNHRPGSVQWQWYLQESKGPPNLSLF